MRRLFLTEPTRKGIGTMPHIKDLLQQIDLKAALQTRSAKQTTVTAGGF